MRCAYLGCGRRVGLRRYCPAHRVWVGYLGQLEAREIEQYRRRRYATMPDDAPAYEPPDSILHLDPRTGAVMDEYDRLVRESESPDYAVRRLIVYHTDSAPFAKLVDLALARGWGQEVRAAEGGGTRRELAGEELRMLRDAYAHYRQRLQVELLAEGEPDSG